MRTRRYKDYTVIEFAKDFHIRFRPPLILRKIGDETDYLVEGELTCSVRDPFVSSQQDLLQSHRWAFSLKARKDLTGVHPMQFINRDQNGSYSTFFRALVWDHVRRAL